VSGSGDRWLLLHGTPLTPAVWDGVAVCLTQSGTVLSPAITPDGDAGDAQGALAARLTAEVTRPNGADRTASIRIPATLIAAELDQVSTPAAMSALASRLPRATLKILSGAAHMTPFTDPAALAELILRAARR
jgi:pimeloyl-ACP methyl ester carboxylesterase